MPDQTSSSHTISRHWRIAEFGKLMALRKKYEEALSYFRLAIKEANQSPGEELAARHYAECCLEVFEHMESYESVISYCDEALGYYYENPPSSPIAQKDQICLIERKGLAMARQGLREEAIKLFETAIHLAEQIQIQLPIAKTAVSWYKRGYDVSLERLNQLLTQHNYYSVRKDKVDPDIALEVSQLALA